MNWKYIKSFLILLIVLVDILLVGFCYDSSRARAFPARETAEDAVAVLQAGGIEVSADLLAVRADSAPTRRCAYTREDYARLVFGILCGKDADGFFLLPDGIRAVTADGDAARLGYDFSLEFVAAGRDVAVIEAAYAKGYTATADTEAVRRALETLLGLPEGAAKSFPATTADGYGNYYLQMGIETGCLSLVLMLAFFVIFLKRGFAAAKGKCHTQKEYFIRAILISVLGYLFAGMFNDSMVVTAPVFWCLLGLGAGGMGDRVRNTIS